ncbi:MAG: hypothetical protein ABEK00_02970 [Candidatus Nanohaloarchaea archaeon]
MRSNRYLLGQSFMPDFLASMLVFGVILSIFVSSWNTVLSNQTEFEGEEQMRFRGLHTTTFLVSTPGYPVNWEEPSKDVAVPGFAEPDHLLQEDKLKAFRELSYDRQREVLQARNFYLVVRNESGVIEMNGDKLVYGRDYSNASTVVPFTRSVQVNVSNEILNAEMRYIVWR